MAKPIIVRSIRELGAVLSQADRESRSFRERLSEKYESNAEVQRLRSMSKDERAANAVDVMTGKIKEHNDAKAGTSTSEEAARDKARELAKKSGISDA